MRKWKRFNYIVYDFENHFKKEYDVLSDIAKDYGVSTATIQRVYKGLSHNVPIQIERKEIVYNNGEIL